MTAQSIHRDPDSLDSAAARADFRKIADLLPHGAKVLDVGCGDGGLLALLQREKNIDGRGIELSQSGVNACVARGLFVVQGDADSDLADYPDNGFDTVILSQTIQATRNPRAVLEHLLRIGRRAIVSFPNFGHWRVRGHLFMRGHMPVTRNLPAAWYETENIHFCTLTDFTDLVAEIGARTDHIAAFTSEGRPLPLTGPLWLLNLVASQAMFVLRR
ncbi:MAG: methionine biosynthesis protein MetW [Rhodobiaceae bacterium]|nr:methionine biosynthesis protein MetW [Rhodobiaceae bacterium]